MWTPSRTCLGGTSWAWWASTSSWWRPAPPPPFSTPTICGWWSQREPHCQGHLGGQEPSWAAQAGAQCEPPGQVGPREQSKLRELGSTLAQGLLSCTWRSAWRTRGRTMSAFPSRNPTWLSPTTVTLCLPRSHNKHYRLYRKELPSWQLGWGRGLGRGVPLLGAPAGASLAEKHERQVAEAVTASAQRPPTLAPKSSPTSPRLHSTSGQRGCALSWALEEPSYHVEIGVRNKCLAASTVPGSGARSSRSPRWLEHPCLSWRPTCHQRGLWLHCRPGWPGLPLHKPPPQPPPPPSPARLSPQADPAQRETQATAPATRAWWWRTRKCRGLPLHPAENSFLDRLPVPGETGCGPARSVGHAGSPATCEDASGDAQGAPLDRFLGLTPCRRSTWTLDAVSFGIYFKIWRQQKRSHRGYLFGRCRRGWDAQHFVLHFFRGKLKCSPRF